MHLCVVWPPQSVLPSHWWRKRSLKLNVNPSSGVVHSSDGKTLRQAHWRHSLWETGRFLEQHLLSVCYKAAAIRESIKPISPPGPSLLHPQLHGSSAKSLLPMGLTRSDPRRGDCSPATEIRLVVLQQMCSISLAPFLVCLSLWPVSCFHSAKWLVSHCNPLRWEDKGRIQSSVWSNAPRHLIKSSLPLSSSRRVCLQTPACVAVFETLLQHLWGDRLAWTKSSTIILWSSPSSALDGEDGVSDLWK